MFCAENFCCYLYLCFLLLKKLFVVFAVKKLFLDCSSDISVVVFVLKKLFVVFVLKKLFVVFVLKKLFVVCCSRKGLEGENCESAFPCQAGSLSGTRSIAINAKLA